MTTKYYYKERMDKPYRIVTESKMKISNLWIDVVIYEALYENNDGKIWVREKGSFYELFKPEVEKEDILDELLHQVPLAVSFEVTLMSSDRKNWKNGDYLGDYDLIKKQVDHLVSVVEKWVNNGYINPIREE